MDRRPSLEDLVCSPHVEPLDVCNSSLSLKVVLEPLFQMGWSPLKYGMHRLFEEATRWLKGLDALPQDQLNGLPPIVDDALKSFRKLKSSTNELEACRKQCHEKLSAINKSAEVMFQKMVKEVQGQPLDKAEEFLKLRKPVIEQWLQKHQVSLEEMVDQKANIHAYARDAFEQQVGDLVNIAHTEYSDQRVPIGSISEIPPEALLEDLENELAKTLAPTKEPTPVVPEKSDGQDSVAPPGSCTEAFEKVQAAVSHALVGTALEGAQEAVMKGFKVALGGEGGEPIPPKDPVAEVNHPKVPAVPLVTKAVEAEFKRGDTTQLEQEELERCAVVMPDGSTMYRTPKGKLETYDERVKRLGHNMYMKFSRTFESY